MVYLVNLSTLTQLLIAKLAVCLESLLIILTYFHNTETCMFNERSYLIKGQTFASVTNICQHFNHRFKRYV